MRDGLRRGATERKGSEIKRDRGRKEERKRERDQEQSIRHKETNFCFIGIIVHYLAALDIKVTCILLALFNCYAMDVKSVLRMVSLTQLHRCAQ